MFQQPLELGLGLLELLAEPGVRDLESTHRRSGRFVVGRGFFSQFALQTGDLDPGVSGRGGDHLPLGLFRLKQREFPLVFPHVPVDIQKRHAIRVLGDPLASQRIHQPLAASPRRQACELASHPLDFRCPVQSQDRSQVLRTVFRLFFQRRSQRACVETS